MKTHQMTHSRSRLFFGLVLLLLLSACLTSNFEFQVLINNSQGYKVPNARVLLTYSGGSESRLTGNTGKVSFFPEKQYLGNLATIQVEANGFRPYKTELKLSSSPQEIQIEQVAGDPQKPDGGKSPDSQNSPSNEPTKPPSSTPVSSPAATPKSMNYPALQPRISVSGKLVENTQLCYQFTGTANTGLVFTLRHQGVCSDLGFYDSQSQLIGKELTTCGSKYQFPFTPERDGQYAICFRGRYGFGTYLLMYEIY
jgi:hypothetical protein